jgi:protein MpaA
VRSESGLSIHRRLIICLVLLLFQPLAAQPEIEMRDTDGDGWPEFVSGERSAVSPGSLILELSEERSLDWLLEQATQWPHSRLVQAEVARRLWLEDRREESLEFWRRARQAEDIDFRLESGGHFFVAGQWGDALEQMAVAQTSWLARVFKGLPEDPHIDRLLQNGWEIPQDATTLQRDEVQIRLGPITEETREVRLGSDPIRLGETVVVLPDIGLQLNLNSRMEVETLASELAGPEGVTEHLGVSAEGRPISAIWFGSGSQTVVYFGAFHGDEPESAQVVQNFADYLREHPELTEDRRAVLVPIVNPDGLRIEQRKNSNQVDLNRNFPTSNWESEGKDTDYWGGTGPASEPETRVVIDVLERFQPDRIISVHCPYKCVNYDGPAEKLAEAMSRENGYKVEPSIGYPTPGSFGNYAGVEKQIPTITLELPPTGEEDVWGDNREALVRALRGVE